MAEGKFISYLRVSTAGQGAAGLGIDAQRDAVERYLNGGQWSLLAEYSEVESGKRADRPQLENALNHCRITGAVLIVAKLDRLSRNVRFLMGLVESNVDIVFCDLPNLPAGPVGRFMLQQMAAVAELERGLISERTKKALAVVREKCQGPDGHVSKSGRVIRRLGNDLGGRQLRGSGNAIAAGAASHRAAQERAADLRTLVADLRASGAVTTRAMAKALNDRGIRSARGGQWGPASVSRLLTRLGLQTVEV